MLDNMKTILNSKSLETAEEIKSADLKLAHSQRLPDILKTKGVAKVTRYGKTEYYVVSPTTIEGLVKQSGSSANAVEKLKTRYKRAQTAMQSAAHKKAFKALAKTSSEDLNGSLKVGNH